ncbi:Protein of unknown function DUF3425 [Penicillium expansum]|uniref:Uncharacterized protein n=1 Tax=Penicillium expansum TaxID=27334 RepID=A0A0A2I2Z4_PENEN|nr:Protein of unknown function DUF3425 [Penicillium expansum]KGO36853.1 Protein of unknown function DUF3425 [Penicillium expansum]KGO51480.1 Protein of unknown function DUF3425 [Penicillium expansum]KGO66290.1 Protein of unknown function DUF3425 [Penicillium expansum]
MRVRMWLREVPIEGFVERFFLFSRAFDRSWSSDLTQSAIRVIICIVIPSLSTGEYSPEFGGKKKALECKKQQKTTERKWVVYIGDSNIPKKNAFTKEEAATSHQVTQLSPPPSSQNEQYFCYFTPSQRDEFMNQLYAKALHMIENPILSSNPTFFAAQYNVLRAMLINADLLGLTFDLLNEDLASQFNLSGPLMSAVHLPASLFPSQKQRKIIHHPWVDLIPILSLREALLVRTDVIDEDEVCGDFYGACAPSQEVGLRVWGEAWDPSAYELSETFIRKWSWIITECPDIIKSSNHWRKQRGEKPIVFTKIK